MNNIKYIFVQNGKPIYKNDGKIDYLFKNSPNAQYSKQHFLICTEYSKKETKIIFNIPKFWNIKHIKIDSVKEELIKKIINFYNNIKEDRINEKNLDLINQNSDFDSDLFYLKKIFNLVQKYKNTKEKVFFSEEMEIANIDHEKTAFNNQKDVIFQYFYRDKTAFYHLINSYLNLKFTKNYFKTINNTLFKDIMLFKNINHYINLIKDITSFKQQKKFLNIKEINSKKIKFKKERNIILLLDLLIKENKVNYQETKKEKSVFFLCFNMVTYFEERVKKFLSEIGTIETKKNHTYLKFESGKKKKAIPDNIYNKEIIIDAKYKNYLIDKKEEDNIIKNYSDNDINKLIRDMLVFDKKYGILIYPEEYYPFEEKCIDYIKYNHKTIEHDHIKNIDESKILFENNQKEQELIIQIKTIKLI